MNAYVLALCANLSFAFGSQFFTHFTRKFSSTWMNAAKALIAGVGFLLTILLTTGFHEISFMGFSFFILSGAIGLGVGDIFLLRAFGEIGPGRTMVIFGFHPIIVGIISYILFSQVIELQKLWGILFFVACLLVFSLESLKKHGHWKLDGILFAFLGMFFDACGVLLTRYSFDLNSSITPLEGNFHRCLGALLVYIIIKKFSPFDFRKNFKSLDIRGRGFLFLGAFFGTYLSLGLYLKAIQITDNLALVSSISITSVIFSSTFECIWEKKKPSVYLIVAFLFFFCGMFFIWN